jgi:hypothetical protein
MENNQEHKIDKVFKNLLENQSVTPPADAWMAVHTYTIRQEESKKKVWVRYASLALLFLLFSGLGVWWYSVNSDYETSHRADLRISGLKEESKIQKSINQQRTSFHNPNSEEISSNNVESMITTSKSNKKIHKSFNLANPNSDIFSHELLVENTNNGGNEKIHKSFNLTYPNSDNHELVKNTNNGGKGDNINKFLNPDSVENFTYSNDNIIPPTIEKQIENIESKPLILNDLSKKMRKEYEKKINKSSFEEKAINQDSVVEEETGKKLNLKHPIITFGLGFLQSYWIGNNNYSNINEVSWYDASGVCAKIGIGWKINKKLRMSVNLSTNSFNLSDFPYKENVLNGTSDKRYKSYLKQSGNDKYYSAFTNFGYVNIPVSNFNNFPTTYNNVPDSVRILRYTDPHSMRVTVLSINSQYDIVSKIRKKRNKYGYQIYGLADLLIQRQTGYSFVAFDEKALNSNFSMADSQIFSEQNHFDSSSEYTYGIRVGFGFRYQFSRRWDFYLESSAQSTINSWFKVKGSLDYFTITQRALSLQAGINLNL